MESETAGPGTSPRIERALLALLTLGLLAPFLDKALHIDDPVYVWIAQRIVAHPLDAYGFAINWRGEPMPLHAFINNPPLASYYLALTGALAGWSERALHAAFLLPALAAVLGTWALARRFGASGLHAALLLLLAPGFFVSGTTLMADVPMLALWVCALVCWDRGLRDGSGAQLWLGAALAGLSALTKFPALALLPLLVAHALSLRVGWRRFAPPLLAPGLGVLAYHGYTSALYGHALLLDPVAYAGGYRPEAAGDLLVRLLATLAFTGGGAASLLALTPWLMGARAACGFGIAGLGLALLLLTGLPAAIALQLALWSGVGAGVIALAIADARETRSPEALVLLLWVGGILVFTAVLNWAVSVRSLLPLLPAAAILGARRLARRRAGAPRGALAAGLALSGALSLAVAHADFQLAGSARDAARALVTEYAGRDVRFQGHWGFQYYAEPLGAAALQRGEPIPPGAVVIQPENNSYLWPLELPIVGERSFPGPRWCATMSAPTGAGFYAATWGPLPFAFGAVPPERYEVYQAR